MCFYVFDPCTESRLCISMSLIPAQRVDFSVIEMSIERISTVFREKKDLRNLECP